MPYGDGTGPAGMGPMTGRGVGYCGTGYGRPTTGMRGRGLANRRGVFWNCRRGWPGYPGYPGAFNAFGAPGAEDEKQMLKSEMEVIESRLNQIKSRLDELKE
jgi:hypothetical protein